MTRTSTIALAAFLSLPTAAQQTPPAQESKPRESAKAALSPADFVMKAADHSRKAVEAGTLAMEKTSNGDVRTLARRMVVDHTTALEELAKLAKDKSITLAAGIKTVKPATGEVTAFEGAAFDRAYIDQTVTELMQVLAFYEAETDDGKDPEIEDWADKKVELLEVQLKMAKDLQARISR